MVHVHSVLVRLKDPDTLEECRALMESMADRINYMVDLQVAINNLEAGYSCDLSLTTTWPDLEAYERYTQDPIHLKVRGRVLELMSDAMTIDYTVEDSESSE